MLLAELEDVQADIICLQEVQLDHYEAHIQPHMNELGYDGVYKQKSRESMGLYGKVSSCCVLDSLLLLCCGILFFMLFTVHRSG
jgi:CCR4-NOT transcription complex subunit 6